MSDEQAELSPEALRARYPSIGLAYEIGLNAYDVAVKRLDHIDGRIQTLLTFAVSVTVAVLSFASARGLSFRSG